MPNDWKVWRNLSPPSSQIRGMRLCRDPQWNLVCGHSGLGGQWTDSGCMPDKYTEPVVTCLFSDGREGAGDSV